MHPVYCPYSMGYIQSGSKLLLHPFPLFKAIRAAQILVPEFSKGGSADFGDEFADGGVHVANQPVILQGDM